MLSLCDWYLFYSKDDSTSLLFYASRLNPEGIMCHLLELSLFYFKNTLIYDTNRLNSFHAWTTRAGWYGHVAAGFILIMNYVLIIDCVCTCSFFISTIKLCFDDAAFVYFTISCWLFTLLYKSYKNEAYNYNHICSKEPELILFQSAVMLINISMEQ